MHIRGQALNEQIYQYIIVLSGGLGFLYGAYMESFGYCVRAWFGGCCLACLVSGAAVRSRRAMPCGLAAMADSDVLAARQRRACLWLACRRCSHVLRGRRSASRSGASSTATRSSGWIQRH